MGVSVKEIGWGGDGSGDEVGMGGRVDVGVWVGEVWLGTAGVCGWRLG